MPTSDSSPAGDEEIPPLGDFFILRSYTPKTYVFSLADGTSLTQTCDALDSASTDFDLTGQIVWMVSRVTAHYIAREGERLLAGARVLELGAGAGLVGLVASRWARELTLSDNEGEVLSLLERNLAHVPPSCSASVVDLDWGDARAHARLQPFPVILGADVVFWSAAIAPLISSVAALLHRPGGVFILGYYNRVESMRTRLLEEAAKAGLVWEVVGWEWLGDEPPEEYRSSLHNMCIYRFTWAGAVR